MIYKSMVEQLYDISKQVSKKQGVSSEDLFFNLVGLYSNKVSDYVRRDLSLGKSFPVMIAKEQSERALRVISEYASRKCGYEK